MIVQLFAREEEQTLFAFNTPSDVRSLVCQYYITYCVFQNFGSQTNIQVQIS